MTDLTQPLWGTGHGNKRHLVDFSRTRYQGASWSRCGVNSPLNHLATDSTQAAKAVEDCPPCARCQKIADKEAGV